MSKSKLGDLWYAPHICSICPDLKRSVQSWEGDSGYYVCGVDNARYLKGKGFGINGNITCPHGRNLDAWLAERKALDARIAEEEAQARLPPKEE